MPPYSPYRPLISVTILCTPGVRNELFYQLYVLHPSISLYAARHVHGERLDGPDSLCHVRWRQASGEHDGSFNAQGDLPGYRPIVSQAAPAPVWRHGIQQNGIGNALVSPGLIYLAATAHVDCLNELDLRKRFFNLQKHLRRLIALKLNGSGPDSSSGLDCFFRYGGHHHYDRGDEGRQLFHNI